MPRKKPLPQFDQIEIIDAGARGKAVGKAPDGRIIFLPLAVPGDVVSVQAIKKRKGYYEGRLLKVTQASPNRIHPKCEHFGLCGGCKWQHMDYPTQLKFKEKEVHENLQRIGQLELPEYRKILPAPKQFNYRNKMEFSFSSRRWLTEEEIHSSDPIGSRNALGLHIPGKWDKVLDLKQCYLQQSPSEEIRKSIKAYAEEHQLEFFDPVTQQGFLRTLMIRTSSTGQVMVLIQFFKEQQEQREGLLNYIRSEFPEITSLQYTINSKKNDTLYDQEIICHSGEDYILEAMEELQFKITAKSFYQTNSAQAYNLYKIVREFADLSGREIVYDLYTGLGTIAQFIASKALKVVGIEAVPEAILAARENTVLNAIENCSFYDGDMRKILSDDFIQQNGVPDVVITDPPREGMHPDVVAQLLKVAPGKIVYVSCNSATQARDLSLMKDKYELQASQAVDMFPQTHHVENVVLLTLKA